MPVTLLHTPVPIKDDGYTPLQTILQTPVSIKDDSHTPVQTILHTPVQIKGDSCTTAQAILHTPVTIKADTLRHKRFSRLLANSRQFAQHKFMIMHCLIATSETGNFERGISGTVKYIYLRLD